jgi:uncharacterized membrane protein
MNSQLSSQLWFKPGINGLPYELPIHPNLVHFTIGLFIIGITFDIAGTLFPLERPIFKYFGFTALRSGFYSGFQLDEVQWQPVNSDALVQPVYSAYLKSAV